MGFLVTNQFKTAPYCLYHKVTQPERISRSSKQGRHPPRKTTVTVGKKTLPAEKQLPRLKRRLQCQSNNSK